MKQKQDKADTMTTKKGDKNENKKGEQEGRQKERDKAHAVTNKKEKQAGCKADILRKL